MNAAALLITGEDRYNHIIPLLHDVLHWLRVEQQIQYKITLLVYESLHGTAPEYMSEHCITLINYSSHYQLHAVARSDIVVPRTCTRQFGPPELPLFRAYSLELSSFIC